ncbi:MAG: hypothetical protein A2341_28030 [Deltaproteobacteria bacterium RIFOXYB12_FULL_58_9]|nr:MAG: hypothetical protein A2341_28030 [Deltaproteobacteria bacterium RIFOXYB12_FULL_58_9]
MNPAYLAASAAVGTVGLALFIYGKRSARFIYMLSGVALMVFPYFVTNAWAIVGVGAVIVGAAFFLSR